MMLSKNQLSILDSCANDWEIFYFLFAEVNYDGQVCYKKDFEYAQYDEKPYHVTHDAMSVIADVVVLATNGYLKCAIVESEWNRTEFLPSCDDLRVYNDYDCLTFEDHVVKFGYGPHEFIITPKGLMLLEEEE